MTPLREDVGVEVGLAPQLRDPRGCHVRVLLLLRGVLEELGSRRGRVEPGCGEVVALVAQVADELRREHLVEHGDDPLAVGAVRLGDRAVVDVLAGLAAEGFDIAQVAHACTLPSPR